MAEEVASVAFGGGTVIFPTDTVYGIGCDPFRSDAIAKIYGAKERPSDKPLSIHLASLTEFMEYLEGYREAISAARRLCPGPVTIIVPKPAFIDQDVTAGLPTLGFRVPDDPLCAAILERCGPLAATSANTSGERAYYGAGDWDSLPAADLLVENGLTRYQGDSTVIDLTGMQPTVLREGVISVERLAELLNLHVRHAHAFRKVP